ncbi:hypothetical protein RSOLAG22IIIB_02844 [Rhizoctonia solani]|uniref:Uncharacterized protein n=1 Tax=Rhizoctonia solani TaxID=456999 RepID=A0A0K6GI87_9AGAM|nr:hypothetical protein RSOLAG22IIIB_02844 [Rhizoctonia solani]
MSETNSEASGVSQLAQLTAAQEIANDTEKFSKWATLVKLDPEPLHGEKPPKLLQIQVDDSRLVPSWIFDEDAPEYKYVRRFYPNKITSLAEEAQVLGQLKAYLYPDKELSDELESALLDIFRAASQHRYFQLFVTPPTEADRRRPLDQLNDHAWQLEGDTDFLHRVSRTGAPISGFFVLYHTSRLNYFHSAKVSSSRFFGSFSASLF